MYLQAFGEILTDALTVNPAIASIPSASAILDASNYTFRAVTLGKDAQGFNYHAHTISSIDGGIANSGKVLIQSYETGSSSYAVSATHLSLSSTYVSSLPNYPAITDTRLERGSTKHLDIEGSPNLGHYPNIAVDPDLSIYWNVLGGYPPSGTVGEYLYFSGGSFLFSGVLSSFYNTNGLIDKNGYIVVSSKISDVGPPDSVYNEGLISVSNVSYSPGVFALKNKIFNGDAACLAAFGGVNHVGIYCIDLKAMLSQGLIPPYSWDALNNNILYKLVAKVTVVDNIMAHKDISGVSPGLELLATLGSPTISCRFNFI